MTKRKICVVGAGRWGRNHIRTLHELGALSGIVEANEELRTDLASQYPQAQLFTNVRDALQGSFDGFTVATPAETHFEITRYILEASKPVLVEKPITLRSKEAKELVELAKKNNVRLMVGHVLLFHPAIQQMKQLILAGKIGKLQYMYSNRLNLGTVRTEENILWSFAPHDISIFQYLVEDEPVEVTSRGGAFVQPHLHDTTLTILQYPNNIIGHIFVSWLHPFKEHRLVVMGSKGMLTYEDSSENKELYFYEKGIDWVQGEPIKRDGAKESIPYEKEMPLTRELSYFVQNLDDPSPGIADGTNGMEVLEILEKASGDLEPGRLSEDSETSHEYFVHPSSVIDENVTVGEGTRVWHFSHVQSGASLGRKCNLGQNVNIGCNVKIGNYVKIQNNVSVYEGVELEDYVFCGPSMVFTNILDPRSKYPQRGKKFYVKTLVKEGASIGANATIVCGNTIGTHAFVGSGAVVTRDVPNYALVTGNPARQVGWMCECGERLPKFDGRCKCARCGLSYELKDDLLAPCTSA